MSRDSSAPDGHPGEPMMSGWMGPHEDMFRLLFERSTDPILLFDPTFGAFIDANQAAADLVGCGRRERLLNTRPTDWSPERQADGRVSSLAALELTAEAERRGGHRFEWLVRRDDGKELPVEVVVTPIQIGGRPIHVLVIREVTERKRAEAAVRESEALLASIADNISEAIYRSDAAHRLIFVNEAYLTMFGYASLDDLQSVAREVLYADPQVRHRLLALLARDGSFSQQEVEYVRKDGRRFWGLASSRVIRDPASGAVAYHVGAITDITEHRRAAEEIQRLYTTLEHRIAERTAELSASEAQLRTLVDHAPEAIVVFDGDTARFVSCNENAVRLFGLDRERLQQRTPVDVSPAIQPNGRMSEEMASRWIQDALDGGAPVFEWTHRHVSGRLVPCEVRLVRLPVEGRRLVRGSITDNSERHRRELIQEAIYQISEAVHAAGDLPSLYGRIHEIVRGLMPADNFYIALFDAETGFIRFPYYRDEFDVTPSSMPLDTGLTSYVLRTGQPLLVDEAMNQRKRRSGEAVVFDECEGISYVESGRPAAIWLGVPLKLQGRAFGVMAVQDYHDARAYAEQEKQILTFVAGQIALAIDRKRAEVEILRALEREKELGTLKSNFVSMVSHEFRTPLGIIMSSAGILQKYFARLTPEERNDHLESIQRSTRRMGDLMEEVLLLARLDAGRMNFEPVEVDFEAVCRSLVDEVLSVTNRRCPIEIRSGLPRSNPAQADETLLRQVFTNLLTNAVKYSEAGSPVEFSLDRDGAQAVCVIRDRGIGIPEQDRNWLFHAFHRGQNVGQRSGTGLGLVIVQRCLELHGGTIDVESVVGHGTTVTVRLPVFARTQEKDAPAVGPGAA